MRILFNLITTVLFLSCGQNTESNTSASANALTFIDRNSVKQHCVTDNECYMLNVVFPKFLGGDSLGTKSINDSIGTTVLRGFECKNTGAFEVVLDSLGRAKIEEFTQQKRDFPDLKHGWTQDAMVLVQYQSPKWVSLSFNMNSFLGGAHPNLFVDLKTLDTKTGRQILFKEIISDEVAFRPMLEKAYLKTKDDQSSSICDFLYPELKELPMPKIFSITREGLRVIYNPSEVAAYAVGLSDLLFTWQELGALADKKRWGL